MDIHRLSVVLRTLGAVVAIIAVLWWDSFYGSIPGGLNCLYAGGEVCSSTSHNAQMSGRLAYTPIIFWIGIALALSGLVLKFALISNFKIFAVALPLLCIAVVLVYALRSPSTVPIPGLPVSWGGHCRVLSGASSGASIPACLVWTDGPEDTRLVIGQSSAFAPQLGAYGYLKEALIDFQLPGHPLTVRIAFDPLPSRETFVTMPARLHDPQATDVQRRLARTSTLVVEWDSPRPQRVSFALNGITFALEGLEHAQTTLEAESMERMQTTR